MFSHLTSPSPVHLCSPLCPDFVPDYTKISLGSVVVIKSWSPLVFSDFFLRWINDGWDKSSDFLPLVTSHHVLNESWCLLLTVLRFGYNTCCFIFRKVDNLLCPWSFVFITNPVYSCSLYCALTHTVIFLCLKQLSLFLLQDFPNTCQALTEFICTMLFIWVSTGDQ